MTCYSQGNPLLGGSETGKSCPKLEVEPNRVPPKRLARRSRSGLGMGWFSPPLGLLQHCAARLHHPGSSAGNTHPVQPGAALGSPADSARGPVPAAQGRCCCWSSPEVGPGLYVQQSSREGTGGDGAPWGCGSPGLRAAPCQTWRVAQQAALGSSTETGCAFLFLPGQNCLCNVRASRSARL